MQQLKNIVQQPIFWIAFFFVIRLIGITNPPLETGHNWRQVTGLMVSRNFLEVDANIFYPRIDDNQGKTGIIGMEFPLLNYGHFLMAKAFGYQHWYGRLINLLITSIGLYYFFLLIKKEFDKKHALYSLILLLSSIWFSFGRKMMPDTFCISLFMIGLYYGLRYLENNRWSQYFLFLFFSIAGVLSKIPAAIYYGVLILAIISTKKNGVEKRNLFAGILLGLVLIYTWYFYWNPHLSEQFSNWYNEGQTFRQGFKELRSNASAVFNNFYFNAFSGFLGFALFISGLVRAIYLKEKKLLWTFSILFLIFLVYMVKSGFYFHHHNYYIIPFVPVMALIAGYGLKAKPKKVALVLLLVIIESVANQQHDLFLKDSLLYKMDLEEVAENHIPKNSLVLINGDGNPQELYLSHRKGWTTSSENIKDSLYVSQIIEKGGEFIIIDKNISELALPSFNKVFEDKNFRIYSTQP